MAHRPTTRRGRDSRLWLYRYGGQVHRPHSHAEPELNLVVRGSASYLVDGRRYALGRHSLLWLFPSQAHVLLDQSAHFHMWVGVFNRDTMRRAIARNARHALRCATPPAIFCKHLPKSAGDWLDALCREIDAHRGDADYMRTALAYLPMAAWARFERAHAPPEAAEVHPAVRAAIRLLRSEHAPPDLDTLAERSGLSAARLSRLFNRDVGVSLTRFRSTLRLERFFDEYGNGERYSMTAAALRAGFGSYAQFHRVFKQMVGLGPKAYFQDNPE